MNRRKVCIWKIYIIFPDFSNRFPIMVGTLPSYINLSFEYLFTICSGFFFRYVTLKWASTYAQRFTTFLF